MSDIDQGGLFISDIYYCILAMRIFLEGKGNFTRMQRKDKNLTQMNADEEDKSG